MCSDSGNTSAGAVAGAAAAVRSNTSCWLVDENLAPRFRSCHESHGLFLAAGNALAGAAAGAAAAVGGLTSSVQEAAPSGGELNRDA